MEELTSVAWQRLENATGVKLRGGSNPSSSALLLWPSLVKAALL